jgi:predicted choloylglycine hydrolase
MKMREIPKRVRINGTWYDVREGWAGKLELHEYMKNYDYTADNPYVSDSVFHVYDNNGSKVGEFDTMNRCQGGCVDEFEM